jgi:membrane protein implicated in regulation of membrane protease activity
LKGVSKIWDNNSSPLFLQRQKDSLRAVCEKQFAMQRSFLSLTRRDPMRIWKRYLLFQIPGWIIAAVILTGLAYLQILPQWVSVLCFVVWLLKDFALYPFTKTAYEGTAKMGLEALAGTTGVAEGNLAPEGYVRIRGELWRAISEPADQGILSGTRVEVLSVEGMRVFVRAVDHPAKHI